MLKQNVLYGNSGADMLQKLGSNSLRFPRRSIVALILLVALFAFEIFNFDTTRYALSNLLGPVSFLGMGWASILAIAFCAIDFAGLVRLFTPESGGEQPKEVWYLMGAWLLGATMNALMTWWAVSLTLLNHEFGNEVLSRAQLLQVVPIFVATLVWLTRILFIGALTVTGSHLLFADSEGEKSRHSDSRAQRLSVPPGAPVTGRIGRGASAMDELRSAVFSRNDLPHVTDEVPAFLRHRAASGQAIDEELENTSVAPRTRVAGDDEPLNDEEAQPRRPARLTATNGRDSGRVRQRPPMPASNGFHARSRGRN